MISFANIQAECTDRFNNSVLDVVGQGSPTNGTSGTGAGICGPGSSYTDTTGKTVWFNFGTLASPTWQLVLGNKVGFTVEMTLTSAQIKAIRATPITILAAQGAGTVIEFLSGSVFFVYAGTNVFTNPQNLALKFKDGTGAGLTAAITAAGFLDQAASEYQLVTQTSGIIYSKANSDNQPLVMHNTGASEITGNAANDNTILVKISYAVWSPVW